jgi:hypothetical protein
MKIIPEEIQTLNQKAYIQSVKMASDMAFQDLENERKDLLLAPALMQNYKFYREFFS